MMHRNNSINHKSGYEKQQSVNSYATPIVCSDPTDRCSSETDISLRDFFLIH